MRKRIIAAALLGLLGCSAPAGEEQEVMKSTTPAHPLLAKYTTVRLAPDLSALSEKEQQLIPLLIEAAQAMDEVFWMEAYGNREQLLNTVSEPELKQFAEINYGPWDRLDNNRPFIEGVGEKPKGANFYPQDMTREEFEEAAANDPDLKGLYTLVRRDESGNLKAVPYHEAFRSSHVQAAQKLQAAAELAENEGLRRYLLLRAEALMNDQYRESDLAWMEMKNNNVDLVIGPIETYEDQLFGFKAAHEAYVLIKDSEWSRRLARYAALLPDLQRGLPVPERYKNETPGSDSDLNAYDVIYYAGDCNAGSKTIAINLPNDEQVQLQKGTRRLQLKNAMRAKFEKILLPIAEALLAEDQQKHVTFDAFFGNTMFHEVAHGLGIKETLTGKGSVRTALREKASALEEGKADVLGLYMVTKLHERGELGEAALEDNFVTFLASIFRSIRFGASSAHGVANLVRFNFLKGMDAFSRDENGRYRIDFVKMQEAINALSEKILRVQGDGDYEGATAMEDAFSVMGAELNSDLDRLATLGIPVDIVFEQGMDVLQQ